MIKKMGYVDYFLMSEILSPMQKQGDTRRARKGSAAGSVVSYCLGITDVAQSNTPLFERFLNPEE
jgi:DNA polymerase-3 subunit alpha